MAINFPPCPNSLKQIQHYLKTALEHDGRDPIVSYWARLHALQMGLKISTHQKDETVLLISLMDWLETAKKENSENESITNEVAAQAYLENYALKLFTYADKQDREGNFGKNVVKAFYTAGMIYDLMLTFGELTEEVQQNRKYAKWKAAYIHNCLKNGETPVAGPMASEDDEEDTTNIPGPSGAAAGTPGSAGASANIGFQFPQIPNDNESGDSYNAVIADKLPSPPVETEKPGNFTPYIPVPEVNNYIPPAVDVNLTPEQMTKAQKYCKWAGSALTYEDIKSAIENLQKALRLLQTGEDS